MNISALGAHSTTTDIKQISDGGNTGHFSFSRCIGARVLAFRTHDTPPSGTQVEVFVRHAMNETDRAFLAFEKIKKSLIGGAPSQSAVVSRAPGSFGSATGLRGRPFLKDCELGFPCIPRVACVGAPAGFRESVEMATL